MGLLSMNFWKNPENDSIKVALLVVLIVILGYFVYRSFHANSLDNTGRVTTGGVSALTKADLLFSTTSNGNQCTTNVCLSENPTQCVALLGSVMPDGACSLDTQQSSPEAQGLLDIINSGK